MGVNRERGETTHDCFILTDQCGIPTPAGLDRRTHSHANSSDWSLLDKHARSKSWKIVAPQRVLSIVSEAGFIPLIELYAS